MHNSRDDSNQLIVILHNIAVYLEIKHNNILSLAINITNIMDSCTSGIVWTGRPTKDLILGQEIDKLKCFVPHNRIAYHKLVFLYFAVNCFIYISGIINVMLKHGHTHSIEIRFWFPSRVAVTTLLTQFKRYKALYDPRANR